MSRRGVAPVVGVVLLIAVTVVLAGVVGAFAVGLGSGTDDTPTAAITAEYGTEYSTQINLTHQGGDALDVRDLKVRIFVGGEPLEHQPDVPFFSHTGFKPGPSGPFNSNTADKLWTAGEVATLAVATTTNSPRPTGASTVTVKIYSNGEIVTTARV